METRSSGTHYHEENIAEVKMPGNTGAFHDEPHDGGVQERDMHPVQIHSSAGVNGNGEGVRRQVRDIHAVRITRATSSVPGGPPTEVIRRTVCTICM